MPQPELSKLIRALLIELRDSWWIYAVVPVVLTVLSLRGWGANEQLATVFLVNLCATVGIGVSTQSMFVLAQRRAWTLPYGLHNPVLVLLGVAIGTELTLLILSSFASFDAPSMRRGLWVIGGVAAAVLATVGITLDRLRDHARKIELREEQALRQAMQAKLDALSSRMNPHFLFNSLNTVAALIEEDPAAAVQAIERLSQLLRYTLERSDDRLVPLRDELHCVREYLELERARFGDRLCVQLELAPELEELAPGFEVPPLVIQPLVENAIQHGVALSRTPVTISLIVRSELQAVRVVVRDDGPGAALARSRAGTGTAHRTLAERLRLLYGEAARFEAGPLAEGGYEATITIPQGVTS
ncbi:sensor histidine kinase [Enhygromyxa salina]|uniref:sensor histidine kinase n=1 Tax=Enhygromyxa salina TaxID=215803 RepID=UPI0015E67614|nr:histidine kinase [Enhygromyxa salina]